MKRLALSVSSIVLILAVLLSSVSVIFLGNYAVKEIRWDKIPFFGTFFVRSMSKPSGIDLSNLEEPYTWALVDMQQIRMEDEWVWINDSEDSSGYHVRYDFYLNPYTKRKLQEYMMENNVAIVRNVYNFESGSSLEEMLEILKFEKLDESYRVHRKEDPSLALGLGFGVPALALWAYWFVHRFRKRI